MKIQIARTIPKLLSLYILEIVLTRAAPAFHNLFMVMGSVFDIHTVRPLKN